MDARTGSPAGTDAGCEGYVTWFFDDILLTEEDPDSDRENSADEDGDLGDVEDEDLQITSSKGM